MIIAVDFDGTCVTHEFPGIGEDIGAAPVLKELVANGHKLILFTMRSNVQRPRSMDPDIINVPGQYLQEAVGWFDKNNIPLYGVQTNPTQYQWTHSPKAYAELYIDDAALGCPLINDPEISARPFVDWKAVRRMLVKSGIIKGRVNNRDKKVFDKWNRILAAGRFKHDKATLTLEDQIELLRDIADLEH